MIEDAVIAEAFGIDEADVTDAHRNAVDRALSAVETEVDRHFREVRSWTAYFKGGGCILHLPEVPVIDEDSDPVYTLTVEYNDGANGWDEVDSTEYEVRAAQKPREWSRVVHFTGWPPAGCYCFYAGRTQGCERCREWLRVTYFAGYEVGALPGDIEDLVLLKAKSRYQQWSGSVGVGLKSETLGDYRYERFGDGSGGVTVFTADDQAVLANWRHVVMA